MPKEPPGTDAVPEPAPPEHDAQPGGQSLPLGEMVDAANGKLGMTTPHDATPPRLSDVEIYQLIQETAYYQAEARGFSPGYEEQDWLAAEAQIKARLFPQRK
jgi:hypothetical protein